MFHGESNHGNRRWMPLKGGWKHRIDFLHEQKRKAWQLFFFFFHLVQKWSEGLNYEVLASGLCQQNISSGNLKLFSVEFNKKDGIGREAVSLPPFGYQPQVIWIKPILLMKPYTWWHSQVVCLAGFYSSNLMGTLYIWTLCLRENAESWMKEPTSDGAE